MVNDDKELDAYLEGNSDLSDRYHASAKAEPPDRLNDKIFSAAKEAVTGPEYKSKKVFHRSPWFKPISIAAMITLSISLVVTVQQETEQPLISEPGPELYDSAMSLGDRVESQTVGADNDATVLEEIELKQSSDARMDAPAPATLDTDGAYRDVNKTNRMKNEAAEIMPAKKATMKEKARSIETEKRVFANEPLLESASKEAELDAVMEFKLDRQKSQQQVELLEIQNLLVDGQFERAKKLYKQFQENHPDYPAGAVEEVIGQDLFSLIK